MAYVLWRCELVNNELRSVAEDIAKETTGGAARFFLPSIILR